MKFIYYILVLALLSCEGEKGGDGIVFEKKTAIVLDSVMYKCIETGEIKYTDSLGSWEMYGLFGGCVSECPDFRVEFSKTGYVTKKITNPDGNIYLDKE
ncbi:hypothetical protein ACFSX9_07975 [Flavobacterium ardleyense]|uniref:Lipoprotein n=1 Tax=Flavobacterium ardleyense TaxID=2038737 RepID=A0ABW5Z9A7_9FLAO